MDALSRTHSRALQGAIFLLGTSFGAGACNAAPNHPLDALTAGEVASIVAVLNQNGLAGTGSLYPYIGLLEPEKSAIFNWKLGSPLDRR